MLNYLAERYKTFIKRDYFNKAEAITKQYAFIGTGSHARAQLYPVLQHLNVPLKYIHSRKIANSKRMATIYKNSLGINNLETIINDKEVAGVFVSIAEDQHYEIAKQLLEAGKHVFIEKPPCQSNGQLQTLLALTNKSVLHVNLQQRFSPSITLLKKKAATTKFYRFEYLTGDAGAENLLTNLFIHPLDAAVYLFGKVHKVDCNKIISGGAATYLIHALHTNGIVGELKLSTAYSWQQAQENIEMHCGHEIFNVDFPFIVKRTTLPSTVIGVPLEKVFKTPVKEELLLNGNNISTSANNHISNLYGFYSSINSFISKVENNKSMQPEDIQQLQNLYALIDLLR